MDINEVLDLIKAGENQNVEFKRSIATDAAKDLVAFLNTDGGHIIFGIDNDGNILGLKESSLRHLFEAKAVQSISPTPRIEMYEFNIQSRRILVASCLRDRNRIYSVGNLAYVRIGSISKPLSIDEILYKASESALVRFDELPNFEAKIGDLDRKRIQVYLSMRERSRGIVKPQKLDNKVLVALKIAKRSNHMLFPTNGGILFFAKDPQNFFPFAKLRITVSKDPLLREVENFHEIDGSIWDIIQKATKTIREIIGVESILDAGQRRERPRFPMLPLREAIINALIHRNYFIAGEVNVYIFPDKIDIRNPGSFPPGASPEEPTHIPRNPLLCQFTYDLGFIEKYGQGIIRMRELCKQSGFPEPEFKLSQAMTKVAFARLPLKVAEKMLELDEVELRILELLKTPISSTRIANALKITRQYAVKKLRELMAKGLVKRFGTGKKVRYIIGEP